MTYISMWKDRKERGELKYIERLEDKKSEVAQRRKEALTILTEHGISKSNILTDSNFLGSWFSFNYNDLFIDFVIQGHELLGNMYREPTNGAERACVKEGHIIMLIPEERDLFQKEFNYRGFIFNGPTKQAVKNIITLAELKLEDVIRLQNNEGIVYLENEDLKNKI